MSERRTAAQWQTEVQRYSEWAGKWSGGEIELHKHPFGNWVSWGDFAAQTADLAACEAEHSAYVQECNVQHNEDNARIAVLEAERDFYKRECEREIGYKNDQAKRAETAEAARDEANNYCEFMRQAASLGERYYVRR